MTLQEKINDTISELNKADNLIDDYESKIDMLKKRMAKLEDELGELKQKNKRVK